MIGMRLGPYDLLAELGHGGTATVYRAYQASVERQVAVKVIHKTIAGDESASARFRHEARLIARLEHPHILPIYDFDGASDPPYIVMRYVDSGTLKDALTARPLPHDDIGFLLRQIASALDYAHEQGIVHCDIKPANIMLDRKGNVLVSDFGIARLVDSATPTHGGITPADATGGTLAESTATGTPGYMAPEQVLGAADLDGRADDYALATLAFELLTGQLPFTAHTPLAVMQKQVQEAPPAPTRFNPALPAAVDAVLARGLAKVPAQRYPTAGAFAAALSSALGASTMAAPVTVTAVVQATLSARRGTAESTGSQTTPTEAHKTVTALYANVIEYATLVEAQAGSEAAQRAVRVLCERVAEHVRQRGGEVLVQAENHLLGVWGARVTREDDAERAVRAALEMQATARAVGAAYFTKSANEPLPFNLGLHTGLALIGTRTGDGALTATGATLMLAEKLAGLAQGALVISHDTFCEVQGVFDIEPERPLEVRGRKEALNTYRVRAAKVRAFRVRMHGLEGLEIRLIGRAAELKHLQSAYLRAFEKRQTQAITLLGEAGVGKSRVMAEFAKWNDLRHEIIRVFRGRATPAMRQHPYALWRDLLSFRFEILDDDPLPVVRAKLEGGVAGLLALRLDEDAELPAAEREMAHMLGYLAGFDLSTSPHIQGLLGDTQQLTTRARQLVGRFFARLGALRPMVIELEDIHHADTPSLELFDELVTTHTDLPLVVVYLARPSLLEHRPTWGQGQAFHTRLTLAQLDKRESHDLARQLLQKLINPPKALRDLLIERAEGNALFMEELVKMLLDDHVLVKETAHWRAELGRLTHLRVPPSLMGVLQARLDTLLPPEKLILQRAAVFGRVFADTMLPALDAADDTHLTNLPVRLRTLEQHGFIERRDTPSFAGSVTYTFQHGMLRDLIYTTLLERQRTRYHAACARWLAQTERAQEYWPLVAEHHEKAGEQAEAAQALERAGDQAMQVSAFKDAAEFYRRTVAFLEKRKPSAEEREHVAQCFTKFAEVHYRLGNFSASRAALDEALRLAQTPAVRAVALAVLGDMNGEVKGDYAGATQTLTQALALARASTDLNVLARILYVLAVMSVRQGKFDAARIYVEESLRVARGAGDATRILSALNGVGAVYLLLELPEAEQFLEEAHAAALATNNRNAAMIALNNLGAFADRRNDWISARTAYGQAVTLARELGTRAQLALYLLNLAGESILLRDYAHARAELREGLALARELGSLTRIIMSIAFYADLLAVEGQTARALALLGLIQHHPGFFSELKDEVERMLARWALDPATVAAGLAAGTALDFDTTVAEIVRELEQEA